jgi:hypothetical protein
MKTALLVLLLVTSALLTAQAPAPKPGITTPDPPKPRPTLSDDARKNILIDYQMAVIAQDQKVSAEKSSDAATQNYLATCKREATAAGFPDGTQCQVDIASKIVTPIPPLPPPAPAKKAEEPAAKK